MKNLKKNSVCYFIDRDCGKIRKGYVVERNKWEKGYVSYSLNSEERIYDSVPSAWVETNKDNLDLALSEYRIICLMCDLEKAKQMIVNIDKNTHDIYVEIRHALEKKESSKKTLTKKLN